jgi:hypothetical protein
MVETLRFSKIGIDDLSLGSGTFEARLADERIVAKQQINLKRLAPDITAASVLFMGSTDVAQDSTFTFDSNVNRLHVPNIVGGSSSGGDLVLDSTTNATKGDIIINSGLGKVGIVQANPPLTTMHMGQAGPCTLTVENVSGVTSGDPAIQFQIAASTKFKLGVDDSDGDKFKIVTGGTLGASPAFAIDSSSNVGVGEETPLGKLHVKGAESSATPAAGGDTLVVEGSTSAGISIMTTNTGSSSINFSDPDVANDGSIIYSHSTQQMNLITAGATRLVLTSSGAMLNEIANLSNSNGLTINQTASDNEILSLKSSDVAHGVTSVTETDTYGFIIKHTGSSGGAKIVGLSEIDVGAQLEGIVTTEDSSKGSGSTGAVQLTGTLKSGTSRAAMSANANVMVVASNTGAKLIVDADGDLHVDGSGTLATFDAFDDVALLTAVKSAMVSESSKATLGEFLNENRAILEQHGVISPDGFISYKGVCGLMIDAFRQIDSRLRAAGI